MWKKGFWIGTASGLALGFYMWIIESLTEIKIYTLLMNVDFIPVIGDIDWPVFIEWLFHMIISWGIGIFYCFLLRNRQTNTVRLQWMAAYVLSAIAASTYFPLTILAIKETPSVTNIAAISFWLAGHILYATILKASYSIKR
ncbi:hypothetical protein [Halobacillus sp. Marseille-Q1614]|uniref:hypothetical protein n=1 Tax=Halobacillus sp. Marseille-Q1614 TaxID=2709134 RepID=UPI00157128DE|nr:hypothetical protein [Halobacillus sp. Marseille-Q1614]